MSRFGGCEAPSKSTQNPLNLLDLRKSYYLKKKPRIAARLLFLER